MTDVENRPARDVSDHGTPGDIQDAWRILAGGSVVAARALTSIAGDPDAPAASRVTASQTILKMVGFGADEVRVRIVPSDYDQAAPSTGGVVTAAQIVRDRMALIAAKEAAAQAEEDEVVDAIIVEDQAYG